MKKFRKHLIVAGILSGCFVQAKMVITTPTGRSDESDVVLEKAVEAVRQAPADTVSVIEDTAAFVADDFRNTAQVVESAFNRATPGETVPAEMIRRWTRRGRFPIKSECNPTT